MQREWTCPYQPQLNIFNYIMVQFCLGQKKTPPRPGSSFRVFPLNTNGHSYLRNGSDWGIAHKNVVSCFRPVLTSLLVLSGHHPSAFQGKITAQSRAVLGGPRLVHSLAVPVLGLSCDSGRAGEDWQSGHLRPARPSPLFPEPSPHTQVFIFTRSHTTGGTSAGMLVFTLPSCCGKPCLRFWAVDSFLPTQLIVK